MKKLIIFLSIVIVSMFLFFIFKKNQPEVKKDYWYEVKNQIKYFNTSNLERYKEYKKINPNMKINQIVLDVNIGLDKPFYTNVRSATNLNTSYILVNKYNYLEEDYIPNNLTNINGIKLVDYAGKSFIDMINNAKDENLTIIGISGYRSYNYQNNLYNKYAQIDGIAKADTYSARAGYSEHQTGLAVDVSNNKLPYTEFENTEEFSWMDKNAHKYGFILRYPKNKENITGYTYEAWHYRYVGVDIATYIKKHNITFDEYYAMFIEKN